METAQQPAASQQNLPEFPKDTSEDEAVKGALITRQTPANLTSADARESSYEGNTL